MGPGGLFPTNPDLADMLGRMELDFEMFPKQSLRRRGSNGFGKGALRGWRGDRRSTLIDKHAYSILGDTCSRLAYAKHLVASSNINIYKLQ